MLICPHDELNIVTFLSRRTFKDTITFIPVVIILLIPLSPIGHVLVFGAIQRVFPDFFPSCFTERRQNLLGEIDYSLRYPASSTKFATNVQPVFLHIQNFMSRRNIQPSPLMRLGRSVIYFHYEYPYQPLFLYSF